MAKQVKKKRKPQIKINTFCRFTAAGVTEIDYPSSLSTPPHPLQRNYQFDFLRKQHPLFLYFTKLVEQYSKILLPAYNTIPNLRHDIENPAKVRGQVIVHPSDFTPTDPTGLYSDGPHWTKV